MHLLGLVNNSRPDLETADHILYLSLLESPIGCNFSVLAHFTTFFGAMRQVSQRVLWNSRTRFLVISSSAHSKCQLSVWIFFRSTSVSSDSLLAFELVRHPWVLFSVGWAISMRLTHISHVIDIYYQVVGAFGSDTLGLLKGCICLQRAFPYWPWRLRHGKAETGSFFDQGFGMICIKLWTGQI